VAKRKLRAPQSVSIGEEKKGSRWRQPLFRDRFALYVKLWFEELTMKAFLLGIVAAAVIAVAADAVLTNYVQETSETAYSTSAVRI
jgi:hypothetical protein